MDKKELLEASLAFTDLIGKKPLNCSNLQGIINRLSEDIDDYRDINLLYSISNVEDDKEIFFGIKEICFDIETGMLSLLWNKQEGETLKLNDLISYVDTLRNELSEDWGQIMVSCENIFIVNTCYLADQKDFIFSFKSDEVSFYEDRL